MADADGARANVGCFTHASAFSTRNRTDYAFVSHPATIAVWVCIRVRRSYRPLSPHAKNGEPAQWRGTLAEAGVGVGVHYPVPLHLTPAYCNADRRKKRFPVAERAAGEILSLPMFPHITVEQQERVAEILIGASSQGG